jgi:hypothetical protein
MICLAADQFAVSNRFKSGFSIRSRDEKDAAINGVEFAN